MQLQQQQFGWNAQPQTRCKFVFIHWDKWLHYRWLKIECATSGFQAMYVRCLSMSMWYDVAIWNNVYDILLCEYKCHESKRRKKKYVQRVHFEIWNKTVKKQFIYKNFGQPKQMNTILAREQPPFYSVNTNKNHCTTISVDRERKKQKKKKTKRPRIKRMSKSVAHTPPHRNMSKIRILGFSARAKFYY